MDGKEVGWRKCKIIVFDIEWMEGIRDDFMDKESVKGGNMR